MSTVYSPTGVQLGNITLVSDGDVVDAAGINTPIEAVADGVKYLNERVIERVDVFTASGTWTPGANTGKVQFSGCGAGGGGGGGANGNTTIDRAASGGGGGGSAPWNVVTGVTVTAGATYTMTVAGLASEGVAGATGTDGAIGASSTIVGTGVNLAFLGGHGGKGGVVSSSLGSVEPIARGGSSPSAGVDLPTISALVSANPIATIPQGVGGCGVWSASSVSFIGRGGPSLCAQGAAPGSLGTTSGSYRGGGAGGGGGGHAYAVAAATGGTGGNGGNGNNAGNGSAGTNGSGSITGTAYGRGGGGGGGGGHGSTGGGVGGSGGKGGAGIIIVRYVGPQAVIT